MRILWITPTLPDPPNSGGKIVSHETVKHLAQRGHQITLYALSGARCASSCTLGRWAQIRLAPPRVGLEIVRLNPLNDRPYVIAKYWRRTAWNGLHRLLRRSSYHLIHLDHLHTAEYGLRAHYYTGLPTVLTAHNVETLLWERLYRLEPNPFKRTIFKWQAEKMRRYESWVISQLNATIALSGIDVDRLQGLNPAAQIFSVPPGVDLNYFHPMKIQEEENCIALVGSLDWLPNLDGLRWFLRGAWPQIKRMKPAAKLLLVGGRPLSSLRRKLSDDIAVAGRVEDVRGYMARAQVIIVPVRIGSGVRLKVLHALAMGKAVVSTPVGAEGLAVTDGCHLRIAETAEEFALRVVELLGDRSARQRLGEAGLALIRERYGWEQAAERIESIYRQLVCPAGR